MSQQKKKSDSRWTREPMRVLFLVDRMGYPDGSTHGGTTYFVNTLPVLARAGIDLTVCFMAPRHRAAEQLEAEGVKPVFLNRSKWDPRAFFDVLRIVRERRIDVLHLASLKSMLFGRWIARLTGAKSVIHIHDTSPMPPGLGMLERLTAPCTDAAMVLTSAMKTWAQRHYGIRAEDLNVVPNGIHANRFANVDEEAGLRFRREMAIATDAPLVIVAGRVVPEKGQDRVIRAMPGIIERVPDAVLCIVGDGQARMSCQALAAELGLTSRIRFAGYRTDIPQVLAAADVVAVPSLNEPFGYAALEAMAAGKPVVGFRAAGLPEVIEEGATGLLVAPDDQESLIATIERLLSDESLAKRLGEAGRLRARQFSLERHVDRLLEMYKSACARPVTAPNPWMPPPAHTTRSLGPSRMVRTAES